jgi:hypothetical protein
MDSETRQELIDWIQENVPGESIHTGELQLSAEEANLTVDAKSTIMDLPDQEWEKAELLEYVDKRAGDQLMPTGGFFPSSGSPV